MANLDKLTGLLAHITRPATPFGMRTWVEYVSNEDIPIDLSPCDGNYYIESIDTETPAELTDPNLCGTAHCAAGWALALEGTPLIDTSRIGLAIGTATGKIGKNGLPVYHWESTNEDEIQDRARKILGLTEEQANYLFVSLSNSETLAVAYLSKLVYKEARRQAKKKAKADVAEKSASDEGYGYDAWDKKTKDDYVSNQLSRLNRKAHS